MKLLSYLEDHVGKAFHAIIVGVEDFGLFCRLASCRSTGLIHVTSLADDFYYLESGTHTLVGRRSGRRHRLGDREVVRIAHVDVDRRELDLVLADSPVSRARPAAIGTVRDHHRGRNDRPAQRSGEDPAAPTPRRRAERRLKARNDEKAPRKRRALPKPKRLAKKKQRVERTVVVAPSSAILRAVDRAISANGQSQLGVGQIVGPTSRYSTDHRQEHLYRSGLPSCATARGPTNVRADRRPRWAAQTTASRPSRARSPPRKTTANSSRTYPVAATAALRRAGGD